MGQIQDLEQKEIIEILDFDKIPTTENIQIPNRETTPIVLLAHDGFFYGPFLVSRGTTQEGTLELSPLTRALKFPSFHLEHIIRIPKSNLEPMIFTAEINEISRDFIYDLQHQLAIINETSPLEQIDFISAQDLLKWGKDVVINKKLLLPDQSPKNGKRPLKRSKWIKIH